MSWRCVLMTSPSPPPQGPVWPPWLLSTRGRGQFDQDSAPRSSHCYNSSSTQDPQFRADIIINNITETSAQSDLRTSNVLAKNKNKENNWGFFIPTDRPTGTSHLYFKVFLDLEILRFLYIFWLIKYKTLYPQVLKLIKDSGGILLGITLTIFLDFGHKA